MQQLDVEVLPLLVGVGVVVATAIVAKIYFVRKKTPPVTLKDPDVKYPLKLVKKEVISPDTRLFRFELPTDSHVLGLPVGQHIYLSARVNNTLCVRPYTPVSSDDEKGYTDLVIKVYFKNTHPKFPEGGIMTQYLENMKIGETIDVRGPSGLLKYDGNGVFAIKANKKAMPTKVRAEKINMIAGGTGLTPMYQLIKQFEKEKVSGVKIALIYANQTEEDILLRDELEGVQSTNPDLLKLWYTVDRPKDGWKYSSGFVNAQIITEHLYPPSDDTLVLMCGPPPMINFACQPNLDKLGYSQSLRFSY